MTTLNFRGLSGAKSVKLIAAENKRKLLANPDILSRTFRLYNDQQLRKGYWAAVFPDYLDSVYPEGHPMRDTRRTNLKRQLWGDKAIQLPTLIEGLLVLLSGFDSIQLEFHIDSDVKLYTWVVDINDEALEASRFKAVPVLPASDDLVVPLDYVRPDKEHLFVIILRDLLMKTNVKYPDIREMLKANYDTLSSKQLRDKYSNFKQSVARGSLSWDGLVGVLKGLGMRSIRISILGIKDDVTVETSQAISLNKNKDSQ